MPFAGEAKSETNGTAGGKVEWAVWWPADEEGFVRSYCNTVPTPEGGTRARTLTLGGELDKTLDYVNEQVYGFESGKPAWMCGSNEAPKEPFKFMC